METEMVNVKLSRETVAFMKELAQRINAQDNRATAKPYFFVITKERWRVAHEDYANEQTKRVWVDTSGEDEYHEWSSKSECIENLVNDGMRRDEAEDLVEERLTEFTMEKYEEEDNAFLTEHGFNEHVEQNGHNLGKRGKSFTSYLKHAYRNPEMSGLFKAIAEFSGD